MLPMFFFVFLLSPVTGNLTDDLQQQHFQLQQNQLKILERMRPVAILELKNKINSTIVDFDRRLKAMEQKEKQWIRQLEALVTETKDKNSTGAVFTRWGRKDCPARTSSVLYSGSVGGSWYDHTGGAATYLCLSRNPQRLKNLPHANAYLYGAEYDADNEFGNGLKNGDDIPCAVCKSKTGSQKIMIPGRTECLSGWTKQYAGYLSSGYYGHKSSKEYICMDENPQAAHKGHHNDNGAVVYPVKAVCGSLPCPPYRNGDSVTCVICTK